MVPLGWRASWCLPVGAPLLSLAGLLLQPVPQQIEQQTEFAFGVYILGL